MFLEHVMWHGHKTVQKRVSFDGQSSVSKRRYSEGMLSHLSHIYNRCEFLTIFLSVCQIVFQSAHLPVYWSVSSDSVCLTLSVCWSVCPLICLPAGLPAGLSAGLLICLSICLSASLFADLSVCDFWWFYINALKYIFFLVSYIVDRGISISVFPFVCQSV